RQGVGRSWIFFTTRSLSLRISTNFVEKQAEFVFRNCPETRVVYGHIQCNCREMRIGRGVGSLGQTDCYKDGGLRFFHKEKIYVESSIPRNRPHRSARALTFHARCFARSVSKCYPGEFGNASRCGNDERPIESGRKQVR